MKFLDTNKGVYFGWFMYFLFNPTKILLVAADPPFLSYSVLLTVPTCLVLVKGTDYSWGPGRDVLFLSACAGGTDSWNWDFASERMWEGSGSCCLLESFGHSLGQDYCKTSLDCSRCCLDHGLAEMTQNSLCSYSPSVLPCGIGASRTARLHCWELLNESCNFFVSYSNLFLHQY